MQGAPTPGKAEAQRRTNLWRDFKLTLEQFDSMLAEQDGRCACCGTTEPGGRGAFHVDHDHRCCPGKKVTCGGRCIRGLLCKECNQGLGKFDDDPEALERAARYLRNHATSPAAIPATLAAVLVLTA